MTEFKKGERVLVDAVLSDAGADGCPIVADIRYHHQADPNRFAHCMYVEPSDIHAHPGVPVADLIAERDALLEEVGLVCEWKDWLTPGPKVGDFCVDTMRANELRAAREAANKPREEEVWVRAKMDPGKASTVKPIAIVTIGSQEIAVSPEDIRPATRAALELRGGTAAQSAAFQILKSMLSDAEMDIKLARRMRP